MDRCHATKYIFTSNEITCDGKKKFPTYKAAKEKQKHIFNGMSRFGIKEPERLEPYLCHNCRYWHLGHPLSTREQRRRKGRLIPPKRKKFRLDY